MKISNVIIVLFSLFFLNANIAFANAIENNDSAAASNTLSSPITGNLHSETDTDWFSFDVTLPETMTVSFDVGNAYSPIEYWGISIQDSGGNILAAADTGKNVKFSTGIAAPDTYYLVVKKGSILSGFNSDQYTITSSFEVEDIIPPTATFNYNMKWNVLTDWGLN